MVYKKQDGLFEETEDIKEGGLRNQLRLKKNEKFKIRELQKINRKERGEFFDFHGKSFKMTRLLKERITLAINMMGRKK